MARILILAAAGAAAVVIAAIGQRRGSRAAETSLPTAGTEAEKRIVAVLEEASRRGETYLNVPVADGKLLRLLTESAGAKNVVEIGTSTGYSGLWFGLALQSTGGRLTTFELDHGRASQAREHFRRAGLEDVITVVEGDAHKNIHELHDPIDVLFIDADKEGYVDYLHRLLPLVRPGGLILAHNVGMVADYMRAVTSRADLETVVYRDGAGLAVTLKKR